MHRQDVGLGPLRKCELTYKCTHCLRYSKHDGASSTQCFAVPRWRDVRMFRTYGTREATHLLARPLCSPKTGAQRIASPWCSPSNPYSASFFCFFLSTFLRSLSSAFFSANTFSTDAS